MAAVASAVCVIAAGTGKGRGKGKGKAPAPPSKRSTVDAGTMETIVLSDDEIPARVILESKKGRRSTSAAREDGERHSSSDPLDCIEQDVSPDRPKPSEPPDAFDRPPSPRLRPSMSRLPADGAHTRQLQKKHLQQQRATPPEIVDVDTLSDPIESATEWDREEEARARAEAEAMGKEARRRSPTPSGRSNIRPGSVKDRVLQIEGNGTAKPPPKSSSSKADAPFIDFNSVPKPRSLKAGMKGKNQKVACSVSTT